MIEGRRGNIENKGVCVYVCMCMCVYVKSHNKAHQPTQQIYLRERFTRIKTLDVSRHSAKVKKAVCAHDKVFRMSGSKEYPDSSSHHPP